MIVKFLFNLPTGALRLATQNIQQAGVGNWENRVSEVTGLSRAVGDNKSYEQSGYEIEVADPEPKRELKNLVLSNNVYGSVVEAYTENDTLLNTGFIEKVDPKENALRFFINDSLAGLKQVIPAEFDKDKYSQAADEIIGKSLNLVFGQVSAPTGAVPCYKFKNNRYLFSEGFCQGVTQIFDNGEEVDPANWTSVNTYGRCQVNYASENDSDSITANGAGRIDGSDNLIESPIDVLEDILTNYTELLFDSANFDYIKGLMDFRDYRFAGVLNNHMTVEDFFSAFCKSFDCDYYLMHGNEVRLSMLDLNNLTAVKKFTAKQIASFSQEEDPNLIKNKVRYKYQYNNAESTYLKTPAEKNKSSITKWGKFYKPDEPLELLFVHDPVTAFDVALRELMQNKNPGRPTEIEFPIREFSELDITDIIEVQHRAALDSGKRLYQIRRIDSLDFSGDSARISCVDKSIILGAFFKLGDKNVLPQWWTEATPEQREYGYLCDRETGLFSDNEPGKVLY